MKPRQPLSILHSLTGPKFFFSDNDILKEAGFRPEMELKIDHWKKKGVQMFSIEGMPKKHSDYTVSDDPNNLFISVDLNDFKIIFDNDQKIEVKVHPVRKLVVSLIPKIEKNMLKEILAKGIKSLDFSKKQAWRKEECFNDTSFPIFFQQLTQNIYMSKDIVCKMAGKFNDVKTRIREIGAKKHKIGVVIHYGNDLNDEKLAKLLNDESLVRNFGDGLVIIGTDDTGQYTILGMASHDNHTAFQILSEIFDEAVLVFLKKDTSGVNHFVVSASYILPYLESFDPTSKDDEIIDKIIQLAIALKQKWENS